MCVVYQKNIYSDEDIIIIVETKKFFSEKTKNHFTNFLRKNLYKNSFPSRILYIKKFPYYENGKLNRQKLINNIEN